MYLLLVLLVWARGLEVVTSGYKNPKIETNTSHTIMNVGVIVKPECQSQCGNLKVPYPFGIISEENRDRNCSLNKGFEITCDTSTNLPMALMDFYRTEIYVPMWLKAATNSLALLTDIMLHQLNWTELHTLFHDYVDMYKDSTSLPNGCGATCRNPEEVDRNGCFSTGCCQASVNISDFYYIFLRSYDSFHRIPVEKSRRIHIRLPLVVKYKYRSLLKRDIISIWLFSEETLQN